MKRPQFITAFAGICLVALLYFFGKTEATNKSSLSQTGNLSAIKAVSFYNEDSMLAEAKLRITAEQSLRLEQLENSISRGAIKDQQLKIYHQLSHFWSDSAQAFDPYSWYEAQAARLESSEKNLIFAARLFLEGLRQETDPPKKKWKALQAKELYERSLSINPSNDSSKVELGISHIYGGISETPMEGIQKIMGVLTKDSTNIYALMTLADASIFSGQYEKAIDRLKKVNSLEPSNLDAILKLADVYAMTGKKKEAIDWYNKSLSLIKRPDWKQEVEKRISELK